MSEAGGDHHQKPQAGTSWYCRISRETQAESAVITAIGRLGHAAAAELDAALAALPGKSVQVVLDLAEVDYISSPAIQVIEAAGVSIRARGGSLVVRGAAGATRLSLDLAGTGL